MRRWESLKSIIGFWTATILLVAISAFCITGTVMSQSDIGDAELNNYYRVLEKEWLSQTKEELNEMGFRNSGVTLTRVVDAEGNREYTFTIHHGKIDRMSEEERMALAAALMQSITPVESCSFTHEFLMYE